MSRSTHRPPGPKGLPLLGSLPWLGRDPLKFVTHMSRTYGPISFTTIGPSKLYVLGDPELIDEMLIGRYRECVKDVGTRELIPLVGQGLLTSEGEQWKHNRKLASPPLNPKRIAGYADTMVECTARALEGFRDGETRDIHIDMMALTLEIVGKTLLGFDARGDAQRIARILDVSMIYFDNQLKSWRGLVPLWVPTRDRLAFRKVLKELDEIVYGIIERCRTSDRDAEHLLARLVNARDEEGQALSDAQLRDEAVTMLLAGHETTAIALSFAIHALSEHPQVAERLRSELDTKLSGRALRLQDIASLPYLDAVVKETLRLYPPAWAIGREIAAPFEIGGYRMHKGDQVIMSPYAMQRDARYFEDPSAFKPERWLNEALADLPRFAYFPFGGGQRVCIGNHFATMELQLVLGTLMQHLELKMVPGFKVELEPIVTLRPKTGVKVRVIKRHAAEPTRAA